MPRIGALLGLSHEHHASLVVARDARRAVSENDAAAVSTAIERIEVHWRTVLSAHFEQEERLLKNAGDALDPESVPRILAEHAELRMLGGGSCRLEPVERLRRFGELLGSHVRYEERIVFPQLQSHLCIADTDVDADVGGNGEAEA